jgi:hypothetical protein
LTRIAAAGNMGHVIKRSEVRDRRGRVWTVSVVPTVEADEEDFRFWYEELTPGQRVDLVDECLLSCLKTKGLDGLPRLRRVYRRVERKGR